MTQTSTGDEHNKEDQGERSHTGAHTGKMGGDGGNGLATSGRVTNEIKEHVYGTVFIGVRAAYRVILFDT